AGSQACSPIDNSATVTADGLQPLTDNSGNQVDVTGCTFDVDGVKAQRAGSSGAFVTTDITVQPGGVLQYQITASNNGTQPLTSVTIIDTAPPGTGNMVKVSESGPGAGNKCQVASNTVTCSGITLNPGQSFSVVVSLTVDSQPPCGFTILNNAAVDSAETASENTNTVRANGPACQPVLNSLTFLVFKDFVPDNPASVNITLVCTSGTVSNDDPTASESDPANFTVTGFAPGTTCTATEQVPDGYIADQSGCVNVPLTTGSCTIINRLPAVAGVVREPTPTPTGPAALPKAGGDPGSSGPSWFLAGILLLGWGLIGAGFLTALVRHVNKSSS
ncbi:MAG TPA: hypothetical protein VNL15_05825, partial [Dehalococcoidia bacterium]|nr:hypothetical protein [Dehalococcoidia bacterium]